MKFKVTGPITITFAGSRHNVIHGAEEVEFQGSNVDVVQVTHIAPAKPASTATPVPVVPAPAATNPIPAAPPPTAPTK
jgi:hypothetical protein